MAEFINVATQTVAANNSVVFTDDIVSGCDIISHRDDSSTIRLFAVPGKCNTRFKVTFGGNISVPTGGTPAPISIALAIDGEPVPSTTATVTPAAVNEPFNVSISTYVYVRHNCCATVAVRNINAVTINVANANIIVTRE